MTNHTHFPDAEWKHGDVVALRYIRNHPADSIVPARVVEDEPSYVALYYGPGSPRVVHATVEGEPLPREIPFLEREKLIGGLRRITWTDRHVLQIQAPDRMSAVLLWWDENWQFLGYYVNLQASLFRTTFGFDTADYLLDIVVSPDLAWEWKDEEEFALARLHDILAPELADAIRAEGERAIGDIEARRWPFDGSFESWRPDPSWSIPDLPQGWDQDLY
ncbi:MAG TPA: DUF402 domain-containing protein [Thermomicrobiales bacterium]|nr:DUF402 domain-containing protein [Thermomicrobiales bacterium]